MLNDCLRTVLKQAPAFACLLVLAGAQPAAATLIEEELFATGDATIQRNTPTTNYGGSTLLKIANNAGSPSLTIYKSYIRFDLTGIDIASLTDAALVLTVQDSGSGGTATAFSTFEVYGLTDESKENWVETAMGPPGPGIVWGSTAANAAPANVLTNNNFVGAPTTSFLGNFTVLGQGVAGSEYVAVSGTALTSFLQSSTNSSVSFLLRRTTAGSTTNRYVHAFASREFGTTVGPRLLLQLEVVPEPATIVLLGSGLGGLALETRRRRRRKT